jgi:aspartate aminotransferase
LNDAGLFEEWKQDIWTMAGRIIDMRKELHLLLTEELKTPGNWDHIINQIGMFRLVYKLTKLGCSGLLFVGSSFTGISPEQSKALTEKAHVYLTTNGRISMAGLNRENIRYFAESLDKAVRGHWQL